MGVREDLIAAKALIDTPEKWGKGLDSFTRSYGTSPIGATCAMGACNAIAHVRSGYFGHRNDGLFILLAKALRAQLPVGRSVPDFNDAPTTTHADIMALFDRAIAAAEVQS